jgi:Cu/Ag efflux pump CusA
MGVVRNLDTPITSGIGGEMLTLPIAVLASFIPMYYLHVSSNIMSLGGLALAIGVLVDAAIVMVPGLSNTSRSKGL